MDCRCTRINLHVNRCKSNKNISKCRCSRIIDVRGCRSKRLSLYIYYILRKNQNGFRTNRSTTGQILTVRRIIEGVNEKNLTATLLFIDFSKAFDSIHRGKMAEILKAYGIPEKIINAIMIAYKDTKSIVRSDDGDTEFINITGGVLQGDTLAPFLFIICLDYVLKMSLDR